MILQWAYLWILGQVKDKTVACCQIMPWLLCTTAVGTIVPKKSRPTVYYFNDKLLLQYDVQKLDDADAELVILKGLYLNSFLSVGDRHLEKCEMSLTSS